MAYNYLMEPAHIYIALQELSLDFFIYSLYILLLVEDSKQYYNIIYNNYNTVETLIQDTPEIKT